MKRRYGDVTIMPAVIHPNTPDPNCACGLSKCDRTWVYCDTARLETWADSLRSSGELPADAPLSSAELLAAFDKMAQSRREQTAAEFREFDRQRRAGGAGSATADTPAMTPGSGAVGVTAPPVSPRKRRKADGPRCISNIPTSGRKVAHQCRNRAKYGPHCALHAVGQTTPDLEQFPAALVEQPDNLPFAHDD